MDSLTNHVTIRNFKSDPIPEELICQLLHSGIRASTTGNMQWYSVIVTSDPDLKAGLAKLHFNQPAAVTAPVILTFCADIKRFKQWCTLNNANPGYNNFMSFFNASIDTLLVAQNFCITAENAGLGICYLGTVTYNAPEVIQLLGLPEMVVPVASLAVGWPESTPELTDRLPLDIVIHRNRYKEYSDEEIREAYKGKENLESSINFVRVNNKENLAKVFTDVRYNKKDNEYFSARFLDAIRSQGFDM